MFVRLLDRAIVGHLGQLNPNDHGPMVPEKSQVSAT